MKRHHSPLAALVLALAASPALAITFTVPADGDNTIDGVLNTTITMGAQWRIADRATELIGKGNVNPNVCGRNEDGAPYFQSCQGLFRDQSFTAARSANAPGSASMNFDDGNLNYDRGDITQAPFKVTQDLTLRYGDYGLFAKVLFFHDFVNEDFNEVHPNEINAENYLQVGNATFDPAPRTDSVACPDGRDNDDNPATPCNIVYGPGAFVQRPRTDAETLRQIGSDLQLLDLVAFGTFPFIGERTLTAKIGRQVVNWGESTLLVFNAINQANPINANNFFRVGFAVEEVFTPVGMAYLSTDVVEGVSAELFYQYEWKPLEIPAYGSFYSPADLGSNNAGPSTINISFGTSADDVSLNPAGGGYGRLLDNPLTGLTNTTTQGRRLRDIEPEDGGQYGFSLKYFADWLGNGTELGFYFMNYHSRLPMVSAYGVPTSCAKDTATSLEFVAACSDIPVLHMPAGEPEAATSSAVHFDDLRIQLSYPEDIRMFGLSMNTTIGDLSLQAEVAYRPKEPLQVDLEDVVFSAFGPTLSNCHLESVGCIGATTGSGTMPDGSTGTYETSNYLNPDGSAGAFADTYDLAVGHMTGAARSFPSYLIPYRNGATAIGSNRGCDNQLNATGHYSAASVLTPDSPCYIRGYEFFKTFQFNFGGTYVSGGTERLSKVFGADQVIVLFETGATLVPDLPALDVLQLEAPGTYHHASAGADGSGFRLANPNAPVSAANPYIAEGGYAAACSTNPTCSFGPDGLRFNPHQQDRELYPDKFSWGYDIITLIRYESVLPGISFQPTIIWKHDVNGTAPGLATNFVKGRKQVDLSIEMRYKEALSFNLGMNWQTGGGIANLYRDRDAFRTWVKYQF